MTRTTEKQTKTSRPSSTAPGNPANFRPWVKRGGAWHGHVRYRTGVAQQYADTVEADWIRLVDLSEDGGGG